MRARPFDVVTRLRSAFALVSTIEMSTLAIIAVGAGALLAFVSIADEVMKGEVGPFDEMLLKALRNPSDLGDPIGPPWVEIMLKDITSLGSTTALTLLTIAAIGYLLVARKRGTALLVVFSVAGGAIVSTLLKQTFARPRPELVAHLVEVQTLSFPSGHAMLSAATFLTLGALLARAEAQWRTRVYIITVAVLLTLMVGVSRVYLGVHYPTDVLAGWCAGAAWAIMCWLIALFLQREGVLAETSPSASTN